MEDKDLFASEEATQELINANDKYVQAEQEYSPEAIEEMKEASVWVEKEDDINE